MKFLIASAANLANRLPMTTLKSVKSFPSLLAAIAVAIGSLSHVSTAHAGVEEMSAAANNLLNALTPEQKAKAVYELKSDERQNWHFIPKDRNGLTLKEMTPAQQRLALALLSSGMSSSGTSQSLTIMSLEQVLYDLENKSPKRDPEKYYFTIFGAPGATKAWGWRVEGHHLSLNFTLDGDKVSPTPSFMGSNPGEIREGPRKGLRVLGGEEELGRKLLKSLNAKQQAKAIYDKVAPKEVITAAERRVKPLEAQGITYKELNAAQKTMLMDLIKAYVERVRPEVSSIELAKIEKAGLDSIQFAWAGGTEQGQGQYYRVQGPTFLLEYDNTQNNNNHVHAVWRDFNGDFGEDILAKHYAQEHKK